MSTSRKSLPPGDARVGRLPGLALFIAGVVLLAWSAYSEPVTRWRSGWRRIWSPLFLGAILQIPGWLFRARMDWGLRAAALLLIPALFVCLGTAAFLWLVAGTGEVELPWTMVGCSDRIGPLHFERVHQRHEVSAKPRGNCLPQASGDGTELFSQGTRKAAAEPARQLVSMVAGVWVGQASRRLVQPPHRHNDKVFHVGPQH